MSADRPFDLDPDDDRIPVLSALYAERYGTPSRRRPVTLAGDDPVVDATILLRTLERDPDASVKRLRAALAEVNANEPWVQNPKDRHLRAVS